MSAQGVTARHWRVATDADRICWLTFDKADSSANTLSSDVLAELDRVLDALAAQQVRGLVFESAKRSGFILGADVKEFGRLRDAAQATEMAARGQALLARVASLGVPTVALIDGFALGGGLELALACDYRVAAVSYERTLGLPEVQLGIHPGFGGTVRSVAILGAPLALDLMLTGRSLSPQEALKCGLVDRVVKRVTLFVIIFRKAVRAVQRQLGAVILCDECRLGPRRREEHHIALLRLLLTLLGDLLPAAEPLFARFDGETIGRR